MAEARRKENEETKKIKNPKPKTHKECLPVPEGLLKNENEGDEDVSVDTKNEDGNALATAVTKMPEVEREYVQKVYDVVAKQWHARVYRSWRRLKSLSRTNRRMVSWPISVAGTVKTCTTSSKEVVLS